MKNVIFFLKCFLILAVLVPLGLLAQDTIPPSDTLTIPPINPDDGAAVLIDKFTGIWLGAIAVVFPLLTWLGSKWTWLSEKANLKLISALVAALIAVVAILWQGLPPLAVGGVLYAVTFVINLITGWVKSSEGMTIAGKKAIMDAGKASLRM